MQMIMPLTALRGLAAFVVMGYHFAPMMDGIPIFNRGFLGVDFFFILSGFILTHVYNQRLSFRSFYLARIARTYPLHLFTLMLLLPAFGRGSYFSADALLCNLTLTQVACGGPMSWNPVSWSLSAEWVSYLLFPFLIGPLLACPRWVAGSLVLSSAAILIAISPISIDDTYRIGGLSRSLPEFLTGMILYRIYVNGWLAHWAWFCGAVVVLVAAFATRAPDFLVIFVFAAIILSSPYVRALEHRALVFLGDISFALYMLHPLVGFFMAATMMALGVRLGIGVAVAAMGASLVVAVLTYRCVEEPARAGLRKWMASPQVRSG